MESRIIHHELKTRFPQASPSMAASPKPTPPSPEPESLSLQLGKELTNSIGMKLKLIPAGEFQMGSTDTNGCRRHEKPRHLVKISRPFYLGVYPVTQREYMQVIKKRTRASSRATTAFRSRGLLARCGRVLQRTEPEGGSAAVLHDQWPVGRGSRLERAGLPAADGGGVGICLPGGDHDAVLLRRR